MEKICQKIKNNFWEILVYFLSFCFFIFNARYVSYPDEFVNLLGAKSILEGKIPYKNFFDHHLPLAWYLGAFLLKISFNSYTLFRLTWSIFNFILLSALGLFIKNKSNKLYPFYLIFLVFYPLTGVYFWFHLYLADSLAVLFFSLSFWLLISQTFIKKTDLKIVYFVSFLIFCLVFSSMTYSYLAGVLYLWCLYLVGFDIKKIVKLILFIIFPYFIYFLYLLVSDSLFDFYFSNIFYNTNLYISIPNYVKGTHFNPFKFALTLVDNFWQNYVVLLSLIKHLDLYLPIGVLAGLGSLSLMVYLFYKNIFFGGLYFFLLSFSAPRSNVQKFSETDYQGSLFLVFGLISALVVVYCLKEEKFKEQLFEDIKRIVRALIFVFSFFSFIFLFQNWYHKFFSVYTQKMPSVYNFSYVADFIDQILENNDYYWIGPYEPHHEFFVKAAKLPGKYPTLLPQFRENEHLKKTFIEQFKINRPKMIIFNHQASIFMTPAEEFGKFFLDWLADNNYQNLDQLKVKVLRSPSEFNIQTDLYLDVAFKDKLLQRLKEKGYLN